MPFYMIHDISGIITELRIRALLYDNDISGIITELRIRVLL